MASNNKPTTTSSLYKSLNMPLSQIKREPLPPDSKLYTSERLSSFRLPRDLTLGGGPIARPNLVHTNKRVYTPNLNAIRNKNVDVKTSRDTTIVNVRGRGRGRGRGAARSDGGPPSKIARTSNFVSTSGLFSEGAGDGTTKRLFRSRFSNDDSAATLRRPTISAKRIKLDPQAEQKHISEIYDLDLDDTDAAVGVSTSPEYTPVVLTQVKSEVKLEERINGMEIKEEIFENATPRLKYPTSLDAFFDRTTPQLFLMQLPDSLPGHGTEPEPAESAESQDATQPQDHLCTMRNLEEGQIGRLIRYRSGKTKLLLGDSQFDIDLGINPNLLQQVVSTELNMADRSGNVICLGEVNAKLSAVPDWEFMLNNIGDKKS